MTIRSVRELTQKTCELYDNFEKGKVDRADVSEFRNLARVIMMSARLELEAIRLFTDVNQIKDQMRTPPAIDFFDPGGNKKQKKLKA